MHKLPLLFAFFVWLTAIRATKPTFAPQSPVDPLTGHDVTIMQGVDGAFIGRIELLKWRAVTIMRATAFTIAVPVLLSGCSTVPLPEDVTRKSTYDIVQQVRCEARRAVLDYSNSYKTASLAYEFDFDIAEDNNASADALWTLPYTLGGSFSILANAGLNRTRHTKRNIKISDTFDELRQTQCAERPLRPDIVYPIAGDIGVYEVVRTFVGLQQVNNPKSGEVFTFADTLMFTTIATGGLHPKLLISPVTDRFRLAAANGDFGATRSDVHTVTLTMAGSPPKTSKPAVGASIRQAESASPEIAGLAAGVPLQTNSSLISTTMIQASVNPRDRALLELDRQRILALQARAKDLIVGP